jgi:hypothetical protein
MMMKYVMVMRNRSAQAGNDETLCGAESGRAFS